MTLRDFWPLPDAVTACTAPEAEALSDAVLLAVHQPARLLRRETAIDERAVLDALLDPHPPEGCAVVSIVGPGGAGKTHLLRWLGLHAGNRHVVRVSGDASLPHLLERVLDGLEGPTYDALREQSKPAEAPRAEVTVEELLTQFRAALLRRATEARAECDAAMKRDGKVDPTLRAVAEIHGPGLVALLEGPTKDVLLQDTPEQPGVFHALARGAAERGEFKPAVFEFRTVATNKLADVKLQRYVQKLKTNTQNERATAAALLNDARDAVMSRLPAAEQTPPADLFRRVRAELLKEGKELVLLIDDLATPAEARELLDAITAAGEQALCTLRAALASESSDDTPATGNEFVLREQPADEPELLETITDTVGAYLNAARLGPERLGAWFAEAGGDPDAKPPLFEVPADLSDALAAFGTSGRGYGLFPFNRAAIRHLAADGPQPLSPRKLIADVLRATVPPHRDAFLRGAFPPEGFHQFDPARLGPDVRRWLEQQRPDDHGRYAVLLGYWGDLPQRLDEVTLPDAVYIAFGLTPLSAVAVEPAPAPVAAEEPTPASPAAPAWANELPALVAQSQLFADRAAPDLDLTAALGAYRAALSAAWVGWVRAQAPQIDDAELAPFAQNPDYQQFVGRIWTYVEDLRRAEQEPAASAADFAAVEATAARLRAALGQLPTDAPAEVKAFLAASNTPAGAPLSALTPAVIEWLTANNQFEKYRIRR